MRTVCDRCRIENVDDCRNRFKTENENGVYVTVECTQDPDELVEQPEEL